MAKLSSSRFIVRYFDHVASKTPTNYHRTGNGISNFIINKPKLIKNPTFSSWLLNSQRSQFPSLPNMHGVFRKLDPHAKFLQHRSFFAFRYSSFKNHEMGSKSFAENVVKKPALAFKNMFGRYKEGVGLQIEAFWMRNHLVMLGAGGFVVCILQWRFLFGIASTFVGFSEGMAEYGFLALSSAIVAFTGLYLHAKFTINPDKVYRMAMRKLNTSASVLEVMGAPLTGTDLRAYVMSEGGISLQNFKPRLRSKRCFLIFPVQGSERKGLVSVEVKKKKGQYDIRLLAVDIPMVSGPDQRLFLIGDNEEYKIGGGLISELRNPVVKALGAAKELEARDDKEDAARELQEAGKKHQADIKKLEKGNIRWLQGRFF
ncbi:uncharacterized protein LOC105160777 [Sesamum indicum]|uniref:Uncharacterized protein LOC105160777 n=1 Tax=Sesamum indicum TaxID=4182 RepID=A0A6I9T035_SESIN|nr:uncharacterized protein LOC105160777 [Sesamum indicum]